MSFCQFLSQGWNATALAAAVGAIIAVVIEYWPPYQEPPMEKWRLLIFAGLCLGLAFAAWGIAGWQGCPDVPDWWTVLRAAVQAAGLAFGAGSLIHRLIVAVGLGYKPKA